MIRFLQITGIVFGMHIIGSAIFFGYVSGPMGILAAPLLGLFGWFFIFPEVCGVGLQWVFYDPYPKPSIGAVLTYAVASAVVGGIVAATLVPKDVGSESTFWIAGFLAGGGAAVFSFLCVHVIKILEQRAPNNSPERTV